MDEFDLSSCDIYETVYFLNFIAENKKLYGKENIRTQTSWRNHKIWKKIYKLKESEDLPYINLYLDMLGFYIGIDTVGLAQKPF